MLAAARKHRSVVEFFRNNDRLLTGREQGMTARRSLARSRRLLAAARTDITRLRKAIAARERAASAVPPQTAICAVFGRYCEQAIVVAWCESRLDTRARNGQYLGLFQMGSWERRLFGHGETARAQAEAAHEYFVETGRDWSPWSCKPWMGT